MADDFKFGTPLTPDMLSKFNASIQPQRMFAESIAAEQNRMMRQAQEVGEQAYQNRKRMQEAMERTAHNTDVTNERLEKMIDQQSSHIELLEKQMKHCKTIGNRSKTVRNTARYFCFWRGWSSGRERTDELDKERNRRDTSSLGICQR